VRLLYHSSLQSTSKTGAQKPDRFLNILFFKKEIQQKTFQKIRIPA
jgi:hypothetical protein